MVETWVNRLWAWFACTAFGNFLPYLAFFNTFEKYPKPW
jgi:hypothetical protein